MMIYAAKEGWYREEANMNVLEPHDILRISTILESWGDTAKAQEWITQQKQRLRNDIQEELDFELSEIENNYYEDIRRASERLSNAKKTVEEKLSNNKKPTAGELKNIDTAQKALDKLQNDKQVKITAANEKADKKRNAIDEVEVELMNMFADADLRKRYFSIVDMDEIEENEFNLNIPRYVDTFEPEEQIDLKQAIADFQQAMKEESAAMISLNELLKTLNGGK